MVSGLAHCPASPRSWIQSLARGKFNLWQICLRRSQPTKLW